MARNTGRAPIINKGIERDERIDTMGTSVYSSKDNKSMHGSLNGQFVLYQTLLEHLLDEEQLLPEDAQGGLLKYFRPTNPADQRIMREFDTEYKCEKAIHWYTRESCIYRILNKALRTQNIDDVMVFTLFIRDLHKQLKNEYEIFRKVQKSSILTVYRGQFISIDEVHRLKTSIGELISMNSFLSTSTNKKKALEFATSRPPPTDKLTTILLEIRVNIKSPSRPLADIKHLSAFAEEEEILFMLGCMFRIDNAYFDEENKLWIGELTLCADHDHDMVDFLSTLHKQLEGKDKAIALGNYLFQMQKFEQAKAYYQRILETNKINDPIQLAYCHHGLAQVNDVQAEYQLAIENIEKAINYILNNNPENDHSLLSECYNDLGSVHTKRDNYQLAIKFYETALQTINNNPSTSYFGLGKVQFVMKNYPSALEYFEKSLENQSEEEHSLIASIYIEMGKVYAAMNNKEKALEIFNKAIESQLKVVGPEHPDLAYTYSAVGIMYADMNDIENGIKYIEKAYHLRSQYLPSNHPDLAESYRYLGDLFKKQANVEQSLSYYHKLLDNQAETLSWDHPSVATTYATVGSLHWSKKEYDQTLIYFHKLLTNQLSRHKHGDSSLSDTFKTLADCYWEKKDFNQALSFYFQYIDNEIETKSYDDFLLADSYQKIANFYYKQRHLNVSLLYYNRLLDCHLRKKPLDKSTVEKIYKKIGKIYLKKRHFHDSLLYYNQLRNQSTDHKTFQKQLSNEKLPNKNSFNKVIPTQILPKRTFSENKYEDFHTILFEKRHLDQALHYFETYLNEKLNTFNVDDSSLADTYQILGNICFEKQNLDQTLKYFLKSLDNQLKRKTVDHSSLSFIFYGIGTIYLKKNDLHRALIYLNRLVDCRFHKNKSFEHSSVIEAYNLVGEVYLAKAHLYQISNYLNKSIHNYIEMELINNDIRIQRHANLTNFQFENRHLDQGLLYFQMLLDKKITTESSKTFSLGDIYTILGHMFYEKKDLYPSLIYFRQLLSYQFQKNPQEYLLSSSTHALIGNIYHKQGFPNEALTEYYEALHIAQRINPRNQIFIEQLRSQILEILLPDL